MTDPRIPIFALMLALTLAVSAQDASPESVASPETAAKVPSPEVVADLATGEMTASPEVTAALASPEPAIPRPSHDPAAINLLEQMAAAHPDLETIQGEFAQVRVSELLLGPTRSEGTFSARRPDRFRYDYEAGDVTGASTYWFLGDSIWVWIPELNQAEVYSQGGDDESVGRELSRVLIGLDGAVEELRASHWIRMHPPAPEDEVLGEAVEHIRFEPREGADPQGFSSIDLWVDALTLLPVQVKMIEESGDETTLTLTSLNLNPDLGSDVFDPRANIPDSAEIIELQ